MPNSLLKAIEALIYYIQLNPISSCVIPVKFLLEVLIRYFLCFNRDCPCRIKFELGKVLNTL